jgi:hypothetical protein
MNASMAVVATRTFTTGREEPCEDGEPVELNAIRSEDAGKDYMLKSRRKESTAKCATNQKFNGVEDRLKLRKRLADPAVSRYLEWSAEK